MKDKPLIKSFHGPHCDKQLEAWLKSNNIVTYQVTGYSGRLRTKDRSVTFTYELPDEPKESMLSRIKRWSNNV